MGQPPGSPALERTLPGLVSGSFSTPVILREWCPSHTDVMLPSFMTPDVNGDLAPGAGRPRSGGGTFQDSYHQPTVPLCPTHVISTPLLSHSHGPSSFSCPGRGGGQERIQAPTCPCTVWSPFLQSICDLLCFSVWFPWTHLVFGIFSPVLQSNKARWGRGEDGAKHPFALNPGQMRRVQCMAA